MKTRKRASASADAMAHFIEANALRSPAKRAELRAAPLEMLVPNRGARRALNRELRRRRTAQQFCSAPTSQGES